MTAPNIAALTNIFGTTSAVLLGTTATTVTATNISQVIKVNTILVSNISNNSVAASAGIFRSSSTYYLAYNIVVPAQSTMVLVGKDTPFYMQEYDQLQAFSSAANSVNLIASYEVIS